MDLLVTPSLQIIIGPVQSGKTTELITRLFTYTNMGKKVLYINSVLDTRSSEKVFSTHNIEIKDIPCDGVKLEKLSGYDISEYDVLGVDECQFFEDLKDVVCDWVDNCCKIVIVSGLDGDYKRQKFGQITELLSHCDSITKLKSCCMICKKNGVVRDGVFSKRLVEGDSSVLIGGEESYLPVCRECFKCKN